MNRLSDIIEMGGNLYEEAWNNGRREALKEVNGGKYEKLEETNASLRAQLDNYEKIRLTQDEEIHRLKDDLERAGNEIVTLRGQIEGYERTSLFNENVDLRKKLEDAEAKIKEQAEALAIYRVPTPRACPFCGGPAEVHQLHKDEWYVACGNDSCPVNPETSCFDTETDAIEAWNNSYEAPKVTCDWR